MRKKAVDRNADSRSSRVEESRSFESREHNQAPVFNMDFQDPTYIPPHYIPEGYTYRWVRLSIRGEEDTSRMVEMKRRGWTPVPSKRHPDMVFEGFYGANEHGHIVYKGNILCERLSKYCQEEREYYEKLNYERLISMPGTENFMSEAAIPVSNMNKTAIGRSFS